MTCWPGLQAGVILGVEAVGANGLKRHVHANARRSSGRQSVQSRRHGIQAAGTVSGEGIMRRVALFGVMWLGAAVPVLAPGTPADYDRALGLRKKYEALVGNAAEAPRWIGRTHKLYYRRAVKGGHDFILVDADTSAKGPAFDHAAIAASLSSAGGKTYGPLELPFNAFDFVENERAIQFVADGQTWRCDVAASSCRKATAAEAAQAGGRGGRGGGQGNAAAFGGRGRGDAA